MNKWQKSKFSAHSHILIQNLTLLIITDLNHRSKSSMISKTNIMSMFLRLVFFEMISTGCPISRIVLLWKLFHASLRKARRPSVCVVYGIWLTASSPRRTPAVPALGISSSSTNFNGNVCSLENIRELSFL